MNLKPGEVVMWDLGISEGKDLTDYGPRVTQLERALSQIEEILKAPASNRKYMQIANPARQCLNIIKGAKIICYE